MRNRRKWVNGNESLWISVASPIREGPVSSPSSLVFSDLSQRVKGRHGHLSVVLCLK